MIVTVQSILIRSYIHVYILNTELSLIEVIKVKSV